MSYDVSKLTVFRVPKIWELWCTAPLRSGRGMFYSKIMPLLSTGSVTFCRWPRVGPQKSNWRLELRRIYRELQRFIYSYLQNRFFAVVTIPANRKSVSVTTFHCDVLAVADCRLNVMCDRRPTIFPAFVNNRSTNHRLTDVDTGRRYWPNFGLFFMTEGASTSPGFHCCEVIELSCRIWSLRRAHNKVSQQFCFYNFKRSKRISIKLGR